MKQTIVREQLPNGIEVIVEEMRELRSVSLGLWLRAGSRHETAEEAGISHCIEHLLFKGTKNLNTEQIAQKIDLLGGNVDAYTSREQTSYIAKVKDTDFRSAFELIAELVRTPAFHAEDIFMEKEVILEEIKMVLDIPDDLIHEIFNEAVFDGHPLGRPILGSPETVQSFNRESIHNYYERVYRPERLVVTVAGNIAASEVVDTVSDLFGDMRPNGDLPEDSPPRFHPSVRLEPRDNLEQVQFMLGVETFPATDDRRHALEILNTYLGGSMSSRLFQNVREKLGLAYSINSFTSAFSDGGYLGVYAATSPERVKQLNEVIRGELLAMSEGEFRDEDIERVKSMIESDVILGMESSSNRMALLARQLIYYNRIRPLDEIIAEFSAVTPDDVLDLAQTLLSGVRPAGAAIGKLEGQELDFSPLGS